jgi:hypothetical protein
VCRLKSCPVRESRSPEPHLRAAQGPPQETKLLSSRHKCLNADKVRYAGGLCFMIWSDQSYSKIATKQ